MARSDKSERDIDRAIGDKIRMARLDRGVSQAALGEKIEITFQQVQKYERGVSRVTASKLVRIAAELGQNPEWFLTGISYPASEAVEEAHGFIHLANSPEGMQLLKAFGRIQRPTVRRRVAQIAAALAEDDADSS